MNKNMILIIVAVALLFFATQSKADETISVRKPAEVKKVEDDFSKQPKTLKEKIQAIRKAMRKAPRPMSPRDYFLLMKHPKYIQPFAEQIINLSKSGFTSPTGWAQVFKIQQQLEKEK